VRYAPHNAVPFDDDGAPTFPILHEQDGNGQPVLIPRGALPSMHSFRHTVAGGEELLRIVSAKTAAPQNQMTYVYNHGQEKSKQQTLNQGEPRELADPIFLGSWSFE
jgi:hypothetical protein